MVLKAMKVATLGTLRFPPNLSSTLSNMVISTTVGAPAIRPTPKMTHLKTTPSACLQGQRLHIRVMDGLHDQICELKIREGWQPIRLEEALQLHSDRKMRCPVCHGRVDACSADMNGNTTHFKHRISDPGCYLVEAFDGNPRPHRKALK